MRVTILLLCTVLLLVPAVTALTWSGGPGSMADNDFHLYLNGSTFSSISWNLSDAPESLVHYPVYPGEEYVFGGTLE